MGGVSSKATGALENDKKYNGIELNEDLGLGTYDAFYRTLDPQIGRWWQIDPKVENMEAWSPFVSNFNSPFRFNDPLGDEPCCEEVWKDIKSAAKETATSVYNGAVSVARTFNTYLNPIASIVEVVTGKSTESDFTVAKPRSISGMEAAIAIIPGAKLEGSLIKAGEKIVVAALEKYEVGSADKLLSKSVKGDGLDVHHVSQSKPTSQIIADYDKKTAPAIALTQAEHKAIPTLKGTATAGNAREQLAKDIKDLRKHTNAPNSSLQNLIDLNKKTYPNAFKK